MLNYPSNNYEKVAASRKSKLARPSKKEKMPAEAHADTQEKLIAERTDTPDRDEKYPNRAIAQATNSATEPMPTHVRFEPAAQGNTKFLFFSTYAELLIFFALILAFLILNAVLHLNF